jgi:carbon storage regulator
MLVLSRRKDEKLVIGDNIELTVIEIKGDSVKLGISAPRDIAIYRSEVLETIKKANMEAADLQKVDLEKLAEIFKLPDKPNSG